MTAQPVFIPMIAPSDAALDIEHIYCQACNPGEMQLSLCGIDLRGHWECLNDDCDHQKCVVCVEMDEQPCYRCGV